jgi:uncharacterized Zn-binding protein involved in type VI secretion
MLEHISTGVKIKVMLKNFENGYNVSGSSEIARGEKNDCVVRAVANACGVNYSQAHKYVADTFDRKPGKGVTGFNLIMKMNKEMRFDEVGQLDLFGGSSVRKVKHIGDSPKAGGTLKNPKYKHKPVAYTVKTFAQRYNKGNFILSVSGHALAVKNGHVVDNNNYQVDGYRRTVESAYQVS